MCAAWDLRFRCVIKWGRKDSPGVMKEENDSAGDFWTNGAGVGSPREYGYGGVVVGCCQSANIWGKSDRHDLFRCSSAQRSEAMGGAWFVHWFDDIQVIWLQTICC